MNPERFDASYTAWDKAIVAKSKGNAGADKTQTAKAADVQAQASQTPPRTTDTSESFKTALFEQRDHERDYDATWRSTAAASGSGPTARDSKNEDFGFWDFVDIINPLQHIPLVSTVYRELTGDEISAPARIMGGALYGGPLGFAASIGNAIVEEVAGKDAGELAMAMVFEEESPSDEGSDGPLLAETGDSESPSSPSVASLPATAAAPAAAVEKAGQSAVLQEVAGNAALQDLLREMGLTQNGPAAASAPLAAVPAPVANAAVLPASGSAAGTSEAKDVSTAHLQNTTKTEPSSAPNPAPGPGPTEHPAARNTAHRSIPIDTSRYINPRAASHPAQQPDSLPKPETTQLPLTSDNAANGKSNETTTAPGSITDKSTLQASFADRMLQALDRYQAMSKQNTALPSLTEAGQTGTRPGAI